MKKIMQGLFMIGILILGISMTGCGTLNQKVDYNALTSENMDFADKMEPGVTSMNVSVGNRNFSTEKASSFSVPLIPLLYMEVLGKDYGDYGYMRQFHIIPLLTCVKASLYDSDGKATASMSGGVLYPIVGYMSADDRDNKQTLSSFILCPIPIVGAHIYSQTRMKSGGDLKVSQYEILRLPILGSCFLFGEDGVGMEKPRHRFLWIPYGGE